MARGTDAARRHADLARIGLGIGDELGDRLGWNRWIDHHDFGHPDDARDRRDVAQEIEIEVAVKRRVKWRSPRSQEGAYTRLTPHGRPASVPMLPPPPGRFSMTNCCPIRRATMSFPPPGAAATIMRTGRAG